MTAYGAIIVPLKELPCKMHNYFEEMDPSPPAVYIPVKPPLPQITITPKILGPFESLLRCSGLDLSRSSVTASGSWAKSIFITTLCTLVCLVMFLKCITLAMESVKPMTLEWVISCVWCFMAIHGFASAVCVASWTRTGLLPTLQEMLARIQTQRGSMTTCCDTSAVYRRIFIFGPIFIGTWILASLKGVFYDGKNHNETSPFSISYPITVDTMFGVEPLVYLMLAFSSTLALIVHVLVFVHVNHEWTSYNEELANASKTRQLTVPDVLDSFSSRQSELIKMTKFVSKMMGLFVTLSTVFASITAIDGLYFLAGFENLSIVMRIMALLWMNIAIAIILISLKQPANTQYEINNTAQILLADNLLQHTNEDRCWRTCRSMMDRAHHSSAKMYFAQAFGIDEYFPHKMLFIVPNIGTLLVMVKKMGLV
ncbi:unnamed protein product [Cylicocyclus nassatus]|uniref:Uncharacterized protein n=1 Tax=Cylicocyclus nassatus TaxID=53992 RepID=A0AA36DMH5_CYLNA|nr:unnamed protein product [Cylicocyclus nassatus]